MGGTYNAGFVETAKQPWESQQKGGLTPKGKILYERAS